MDNHYENAYGRVMSIGTYFVNITVLSCGGISIFHPPLLGVLATPHEVV